MNKNTESILDEVTAGIRNEQVDPATVKQAADRVWARLTTENLELKSTMTNTETEHIENCADFQTLIPAYLNNELSEARSLLLVDHTHECIPCRRAMKEARTRTAAPQKTAVTPRRYSLQPVILRWGIAAALVIGFGLLALPFIQCYAPFGGELEATVQAAEGQVYQIADTTSTPSIAGEKLAKGERVRTAKGAHAMLRLGDGTERGLHRCVAVGVCRLYLDDRTRTGLDNGHGRHHPGVGVEDLAHAELLAEDAFHLRA